MTVKHTIFTYVYFYLFYAVQTHLTEMQNELASTKGN